MKCPACGIPVDAGTAECPNCGLNLQPQDGTHRPMDRGAIWRTDAPPEAPAGAPPIGSFVCLIASIITLIFSLQKLSEYGTGLGQFAVAVSRDAANEKTLYQVLVAAAVVVGVVSVGLIVNYYAKGQSHVAQTGVERVREEWRRANEAERRQVAEEARQAAEAERKAAREEAGAGEEAAPLAEQEAAEEPEPQIVLLDEPQAPGEAACATEARASSGENRASEESRAPHRAAVSTMRPGQARTVFWVIGAVLVLWVLAILTVAVIGFARHSQQSPAPPAGGTGSSSKQPTQIPTVALDCASGEALSPIRDGVANFEIAYQVTVKRREGCLLFRLAEDRRNGYGNSYGVTFCPFADQGANPGLYLVKRTDGSETVLAYSQTGFPRSTGTAHLRVSAVGSALKVYEDGALVLQAEDPSFWSGRLAWRVYGDAANPAGADFTLESLSQ